MREQQIPGCTDKVLLQLTCWALATKASDNSNPQILIVHSNLALNVCKASESIKIFPGNVVISAFESIFLLFFLCEWGSLGYLLDAC